MRRPQISKWLLTVASLAVPACSSSGGSGLNFNETGKPDASVDSQSDATASGQEASLPDGFMSLDTAPPDSPPLTDGDTCSAQTQKAQRYPVDMVIMMDESGSMNEKAGDTNKTKWAAIANSLREFMHDPASEGLGVGIQYFPLRADTNLESCDPWGGFGDCDYDQVCLEDTIAGGAQCMFTCETDDSAACPGNECVPGDYGSEGYCSNAKCDPAAYAKLEVEIGVLPDIASKIEQSMNDQSPGDGTPTVPALIGALAHAQQWQAAHPDHKVIVLLATDGQPTLCSVTMTESSLISECATEAEKASKAAPAIRTFVIGVMKKQENLQGNLDTIAKAGGTEKAFIVQADQDVATQFGEALAKIRGDTLACEFKIPETDAGQLDYKKVNVAFTIGSGEPETIYYVDSEDQCDAEKGGWHYDVIPSGTATPTRILLCPKSCDSVKVDKETQIDIQMGCVTQVRPPA